MNRRAATRPPPSGASDEHLELLRTSPPAPGTTLVPCVVRRARWQGYLRLRCGWWA